MDIQRFLDNFFKLKDIVFLPGTRTIQNLFRNGVGENTKLHFFCDPIQRTPLYSMQGTLTGQRATINFAFVTTSNLDQVYMNEQGTTENKYTENIEPLIENFHGVIKDLNCAGAEIENISFVDVINIKDVNFDGIIGSFTITLMR